MTTHYILMEQLYEQYGYPSRDKFAYRLRREGHKYTMKEINTFLSNQYAAQVMKQTKKPKPDQYSSIVADEVGGSFQVDLMVYSRYAYNHYEYIFMCIDVFSRYLYARALTNRRMDTLLSCFYEAFEKLAVPRNINCDNEFNKNEIHAMAENLDIKMWYSDPEETNKNAVVERCNRTIAEMLQKWRLTTGRYDWDKALDSIVDAYNNQYHKTIKGTPADVFKGKAINKQDTKRIQPDLKEGDVVRVKEKHGIFSKGDEPRYSRTAHRVTGRKGQRIQVEGYDRLLKRYELIRVNAEPEQARSRAKKSRRLHIVPISARILHPRNKKKRIFDADDLYSRRG